MLSDNLPSRDSDTIRDVCLSGKETKILFILPASDTCLRLRSGEERSVLRSLPPRYLIQLPLICRRGRSYGSRTDKVYRQPFRYKRLT